ncbi:MAG TPA: monofunctional biosynthetic peptidoglycan transglycosylase [Deltaproteobacteria bacterium]|nr:monofunctional biosynthetic peptidoglycan transglycosylase [Deltaproteobacteria bacterium]
MTTRLFKLVLAAFLITILYILSAFVYPDVGALAKRHPEKSAFMEYRQRQWRRQGVDVKIRHTYVPLRALSPYVVKAVIIAEDDKFWRHEGFDFEAMQNALEKDIRERRLKAGGSTISQQLAKNLFLSPSKNPVRKIREAIYTWRLERTLKKRRIVELYLNYAEWGPGIFGIEAASRRYFGKPASSITPMEAARLAAVLPNPIRYSPTGSSRFVENRARRIYRIMLARGIVIPEYVEVMSAPQEPEPLAEPTLEDTQGAASPDRSTEEPGLDSPSEQDAARDGEPEGGEAPGDPREGPPDAGDQGEPPR